MEELIRKTSLISRGDDEVYGYRIIDNKKQDNVIVYYDADVNIKGGSELGIRLFDLVDDIVDERDLLYQLLSETNLNLGLVAQEEYQEHLES